MTRVPARWLVVLAALATAGGAIADDVWSKRLEEKSRSVVSVKYVLKFQGGQGDRESNRMATGVVVDPSGVVMMPLWSSRFGRGPSKTVPTNIRVLFDGDEKEYPAVVGATDGKIGIGFVILKDLAGKSIPSVDFSAGAEPALGDELYGVSRLDQGFDYAPHLSVVRVVGQVTKPRPMWIYQGPASVAHPLYAFDGKVAGLVILQGGVTEEQGFSPDRPFLLPAKAALVTIGQAVKASQAALEKSKQSEAEAAAMGDESGMGDSTEAGMDSPAMDEPAMGGMTEPGMGDSPK
jgi:hypothetical protein